MMMKAQFVKVTRDLEKRIEELRNALGEVQKLVEQYPNHHLLVQKKQSLVKDVRKGRRSKNNILLVKGADGLMYTDPHSIKKEIVSYFKSILAESKFCKPIDPKVINRGSKVEDSRCRSLISEATNLDIWHALSKIGSDKSPCLDGFSASFFRKNWSLIGKELCAGIRHCLRIVSGYGRKAINGRMAWKIELRKAYDTVDRQFLHEMLVHLKFPLKFILCIDMCVQTTSFSIHINGELVDFFERKRGFCQGGPISPLLVTIAMEYMSRFLKGLDVNSDKSQLFWLASMRPRRAGLRAWCIPTLVLFKFLCNDKSTRRSCHFIDWNTVCLDMIEGGLGIKNLDIMNDAMVMSQLCLNKHNMNVCSG
ncbi:hypothetical protein QQ045_032921 [Rhodiola kirilowii]